MVDLRSNILTRDSRGTNVDLREIDSTSQMAKQGSLGELARFFIR